MCDSSDSVTSNLKEKAEKVQAQSTQCKCSYPRIILDDKEAAECIPISSFMKTYPRYFKNGVLQSLPEGWEMVCYYDKNFSDDQALTGFLYKPKGSSTYQYDKQKQQQQQSTSAKAAPKEERYSIWKDGP